MIYKVVVILDNAFEMIIYEGYEKRIADDAFAIASGYNRKYYVGSISWELTKSLIGRT